MDWVRPYQDTWGKTQYPWFIFDIAANCFAEVTVSGENLLYYGGYTGKVFKLESGTNDDGAAFTSFYRSKVFDFGDLTVEKKFPHVEFSYENKGDWDLDIGFVADENAATQKILTQNMQSGIADAPRWDYVTWDNFSWAAESDSNKTRHVDLQGKTLYCTLSTDGLNEAWNMYWYVLHARGLSRTAKHRES